MYRPLASQRPPMDRLLPQALNTPSTQIMNVDPFTPSNEGQVVQSLQYLPSIDPPKEQQSQRAVVLLDKSGPFTFVHDFACPRPQPSEVLIRNVTIGLNPVDWKCVEYKFGIHDIPWLCGRESAGVIEAVGKQVTTLKRGDRVLVASTNYRDIRTSTFQEFSVAAAANCAKLPENISFEEGATFGVAIVAAAEALFNCLSLPWESLSNTPSSSSTEERPVNKKPWLLIWGGATTTGMIATQLAKQMGLRVIAVSSLHNAEYVRSNGAEVVLCRLSEEETVQRIKESGAEMGLDCVGAHTAGLAARALKENGKLVCLVQPPKTAVPVKIFQLLIKRFHEDLSYGEHLMALATKLLKSGRLKAPRLRIVGGGLAGINDGLDLMRRGEISGEKVVVRVAETPTAVPATS